jgi:hypothetical protein
MKIFFILILGCIVAGCESSRHSASLTTEQATTMAVRLANGKTMALYQHQSFTAGQPAQFLKGRWLWGARQGFGRGDIQTIVEIARDGSTNNVELQMFDSQNPPNWVF